MDDKKTHTDPRILRTRKMIKDAFIELLEEMEVEKISVNRLAERATINRVTFYLHYRDIPDMLEKMSGDMIEDISMVLNKTPANRDTTIDIKWQGMVNLLEHIAEHPNFYKAILASKRIPIFSDRLLMWLTDNIVSKLEDNENELLIEGIQKDILIWYTSSALIGTIIAWLQNDMPYTPVFLAKQISLIHLKG